MPLGLALVEWGELALAVLASCAFGWLLGRTMRRLLSRVTRGTATAVDDRLVADL